MQATEIELTLADAMQQFDAGDRHRGTVEDLEPEHRVAASSRLARSRKSIVSPSRSTARYRYIHWPATLRRGDSPAVPIRPATRSRAATPVPTCMRSPDGSLFGA